MGYWFDAAPWILVATALLGIVPIRWYVRAVGVPFIIVVLAAGAYLAGRNQLLAIGYFLYAAVWLANFIIEVVAARGWVREAGFEVR